MKTIAPVTRQAVTNDPRAPRIAARTPPFPPAMQARLDAVMRGKPPLALFTTLARDERLFGRFFGAGLLDPGHLSLRERELVIHRTTALCGSAYEWGVHVAVFAKKAQLGAAQLRALAHEGSSADCWSDEERALLQVCEALHRENTIDDALWARLRATFSEEAMLELLLLAGFYRTVSYLTNALRLPLEPGTSGFPDEPRPAA
jgi:alkylhydroperoxidase family enzyme